MPLDRAVLEAILPEVRKKPRIFNADYANGALLAWKQLIRRMVKDLTLKQSTLYSLDAGTPKVWYENGAMKTKRSEFGDCAPCGLSQKRLRDKLTATVHRWAGLPPVETRFDKNTCHDFSSCGIDEILSNWHYDVVPAQTDASSRSQNRGRNIVKSTNDV